MLKLTRKDQYGNYVLWLIELCCLFVICSSIHHLAQVQNQSPSSVPSLLSDLRTNDCIAQEYKLIITALFSQPPVTLNNRIITMLMLSYEVERLRVFQLQFAYLVQFIMLYFTFMNNWTFSSVWRMTISGASKFRKPVGAPVDHDWLLSVPCGITIAALIRGFRSNSFELF